ncbi:HlyD family efflux transporter periplasmic adaptor subunit [Mucilaginibacter phyllosphaerae]|nr:HlyD family efflux transporter periplasmic adaptor subunit [Mucilaginibacter phyllosphaerae]MBB3971227.1 Cu(I)/Ag(I) efflux system membrane fusion protein [Mucilaginibacter phyllosphaerae]
MKNIKIVFGCILLTSMLSSACSDKKVKTMPVADEKMTGKFTCPMHPQIMEDHIGNCPICGMSLVKKSGTAGKSAGISLLTVLQPVNSTVISNVKAVHPEQKTVPTQISAQGYLDFDTRTFNNIAARFPGRIEKLYLKYRFQQVHRGQRIFDVYSPEMVTAQQDLLFLNANSPQETNLISAVKQKLLLLGMTTGQVNQVIISGKLYYSLPVFSPYQGYITDVPGNRMAGTAWQSQGMAFESNSPLTIKEGIYVETGQTVFNVIDPSRLWAVIKVDPASLAALKLNQRVKISIPDQPEVSISGKVDFIEPVLQSGDKTTSIRVYIKNDAHHLKVNNLVQATIQTGETAGLWIPRTAITDLGQTKIVWIKDGSVYRAHQITTGMSHNNEIEIKNGLSATDNVAADAQYLTDSESFIKTDNHEK